MKKKMTMLMMLLMLSGCVYAAAEPVPESPRNRIVPAKVITLAEVKILPKEEVQEEEIETEEEMVYVAVQPKPVQQNITVSETTTVKETVYEELKNEIVTVRERSEAPKTEPVKEAPPQPQPQSEPETVQGPACPAGVYPDLPCDAVVGDQGYSVTFASEEEANSYGYHMLNEVMYIGEKEITNFAVQPVYVNDHSRVAYYGVELYSNGTFLQ